MKMINLKKIDTYLLENYPIVWTTRIHYILFYGVIINILFALGVYAFPFEVYHVDNIKIITYSIFLLSILVLIYTILKQFKFNAFKEYSKNAKKYAVGEFLIYLFSYSLIFLPAFSFLFISTYKIDSKTSIIKINHNDLYEIFKYYPEKIYDYSKIIYERTKKLKLENEKNINDTSLTKKELENKLKVIQKTENIKKALLNINLEKNINDTSLTEKELENKLKVIQNMQKVLIDIDLKKYISPNDSKKEVECVYMVIDSLYVDKLSIDNTADIYNNCKRYVDRLDFLYYRITLLQYIKEKTYYRVIDRNIYIVFLLYSFEILIIIYIFKYSKLKSLVLSILSIILLFILSINIKSSINTNILVFSLFISVFSLSFVYQFKNLKIHSIIKDISLIIFTLLIFFMPILSTLLLNKLNFIDYGINSNEKAIPLLLIGILIFIILLPYLISRYKTFYFLPKGKK